MPSERARTALDDIATNIRLAVAFAGDLDAEALSTDVRTFYAVVRCLEIVSEASRRLDADILARHPELPWKAIHGAGNIYRHDYGDVTADIILTTVRKALPPLLAAVEAERTRAD